MRASAALVAALLTAVCLALPAEAAGGVDVVRAPSIGWNGYGGVRMRTSLDAAARRLGREPTTSPCYVGRYVVDGRGDRTVSLFTTTRRDGRVNLVSTGGDSVRGPAGVRVGMTASRARAALERSDRRVFRHRTRNEAYDVWVHSMTAAGPRGRVLSLRTYRGEVTSVSLFAGRGLEREYRGVLLSC